MFTDTILKNHTIIKSYHVSNDGSFFRNAVTLKVLCFLKLSKTDDGESPKQESNNSQNVFDICLCADMRNRKQA